MSEDHTMDKKNRLNQPLNKGNGSESKKNQDVISSKPRHSRRRESAGSISKNEGRSKPLPQKFKAFDKRPKPRGGLAGGKEGSKIDLFEDEPEFGSLYSPGSKKQNLNHLLNFQYGPLHQYAGAGGRSSYGSRVQSRHVSSSFSSTAIHHAISLSNHKHKYNKEQFIQANCQFVVRKDEDYAVHMGDPDTLVKWEYIEQIRGFGTEDIKCPICLDIPIATQMTRCGHCFCWPCILHYLALSDKTWRKCPICYESIHLNDLKSFKSVTKVACNVDEDITFQLMKRERGSTLLSPASQFEFQTPAKLLTVTETQFDTVYAKLLTGNREDILSIIDAEEAQLTYLLNELTREQCPTLCFTERALELLKIRKADVLSKYQDISPPSSPVDTENMLVRDQHQQHPSNGQLESVSEHVLISDKKQSCEIKTDDNSEPVDILPSQTEQPSSVAGSVEDMMPISNENRRRYESVSSEDGAHHQNTTITADDLYIAHPSNQPQKYFYFYQAIDGQQIFLHAVNVRMLEMTYGSLEHCPHLIKGRVLEKEAGTMTEELRKRLRYLQHLPVTCQFEVAEIELNPPLISDDTVERFKDQLSSRKRRRMKRAREELRRSKRIEEVENKQYGHPTSYSSTRHLWIESHFQFPECGLQPIATGYTPIIRSTESSRASSPSVTGSRRSESPVTSALQSLSLEQTVPSSTSFAQKLREGTGVSDDSTFWPSVGERRYTFSEQSDTNVPYYRQNFRQALPTAIDPNIRFHTEDATGNGSRNKKKKRKTKTLLFTTGGVPCNKN